MADADDKLSSDQYLAMNGSPDTVTGIDQSNDCTTANSATHVTQGQGLSTADVVTDTNDSGHPSTDDTVGIASRAKASTMPSHTPGETTQHASTEQIVKALYNEDNITTENTVDKSLNAVKAMIKPETVQHSEHLHEKTPNGPSTKNKDPENHSYQGPQSKNPKDSLAFADKSEGEIAPELGVYKRRWYILALFSLFAFTQACVWNTFGPISSTSEEAFGWKDADIALLSNWGPIAYIVSCIFFSWMLDVKGLRWSCVLGIFLVLMATILRCISTTPPAVTWLMNIGHLLNGLGGPVSMGAPPILSAVWFPLHERATATAIGTAFSYTGVAVAFVLGPHLVHSYQTLPPNATDHVLLRKSRAVADENGSVVLGNDTILANMSANMSLHHGDNVTVSYIADVDRERKEIAVYMYIVAGWCGALFVLILIYFPHKPPLPPCASAAKEREDFVVGLKNLLKRKQFWLVAIIFGLSLGLLNCWASLLNVNLSSHGISENEAGWIGFYSTLSGCAFCLIVARFADRFSRIMKQFIIGLYVCSTVFFLIFALAAIEVISASTAIFYVTIIGGITLLNSAIPLIYELACELSYPIGEGTTSLVLNAIHNISGLLFLFAEMIPNIGSLWMNWTLLASLALCIPGWLLLKENYNRLAVDESKPGMNISNTEITVGNDHPTAAGARSHTDIGDTVIVSRL